MLIEECYRAFRSRSFVVALLIAGIALAFGYSEYRAGPSDPAYLARLPQFYTNAYDAVIWTQRSLISLIVPLVVVLPFADSLSVDRSTGYLRYVLIRTTTRRYLWSKYVACALAGGAAIALPLLAMFGYACLVLPRGLNLIDTQQRILSQPQALGPFGDLYRASPDLYILALVALAFCFGATYAVLGLAISTWTDNRYIALATPFLIYMLGNFAMAIFRFELWSPSATFAPHWLLHVTWLHLVGGLGGLLAVASTLFFLRAGRSMRMLAP